MAVADYEDIAAKMEAGTANRTVAATKMNATSSRAHTIVGITFVQRAKNAAGQTTDKTAVVNLVDLAGRSVVRGTLFDVQGQMIRDIFHVDYFENKIVGFDEKNNICRRQDNNQSVFSGNFGINFNVKNNNSLTSSLFRPWAKANVGITNEATFRCLHGPWLWVIN